MTGTEARFILGLGPTFTEAELKRAARQAAIQHHPDRGGNLERMVLVNEAIAVLSVSTAGYAATSQPDPSPAWTDFDIPQSEPPAEPERASIWKRLGNLPKILERSDHPAEKYIVRISLGITAAVWISFLVNPGESEDPGEFWGLVFLGPPLFYLLYSVLIRFVVGIGIRIYNVWQRLSGR